MLVDEYRPSRFSDIHGLDSQIDAGKQFVERWKKGNPIAQALLQYGPPGVGKSILSECLSNEYDMRLYTLELSLITSSSDAGTLLLRSANIPNAILLIEELDLCSKGIKDKVTKFLENTNSLVIINCNYSHRLPYELTKKCLQITFTYPTQATKIKFLTSILAKEKIELPNEEMQQICLQRDFRSILNTLEINTSEGTAEDYFRDKDKTFSNPEKLHKYHLQNKGDRVEVSCVQVVLEFARKYGYHHWKYASEMQKYIYTTPREPHWGAWNRIDNRIAEKLSKYLPHSRRFILNRIVPLLHNIGSTQVIIQLSSMGVSKDELKHLGMELPKEEFIRKSAQPKKREMTKWI